MKKRCEPDNWHDGSFEDRFFALLMRIYRLLSQLSEKNVAEGIPSPAQMWFLRRLHEADAPQPISFFADGVFSSRSNATQMIDRLQAEGLVSRIRNPRDRRSVLVELTEMGAQRTRQGRERHQQLAEMLLEPLSAEERQETLRVFARVLQLLERDPLPDNEES